MANTYIFNILLTLFILSHPTSIAKKEEYKTA